MKSLIYVFEFNIKSKKIFASEVPVEIACNQFNLIIAEKILLASRFL